MTTAALRSQRDPLIAALRRTASRREDLPRAPPALLPSAALSLCVAPLSIDALGKAWGRSHLHVRRRGQRDRFRRLFSLEHLDELLAAQRIPRETLFVLDARDRTRPEFGALAPDSPIGADLAAQGASLYLHFLDQFSPTLRDLCDELERSFALPVSAFAFLNPPRAQARTLHWDPLDVIILQVEGEKIWDLHEPLVYQPLAEQDSRDYTFDTPRIARVRLRAGDSLYVPRGFIHRAESTDDISFSITLGIRSLTWQHVVSSASQRALGTLREDGLLRQPLPARIDRSTWERLRDHLVAVTRRQARPDAMLERALNETRPLAGAPFRFVPGHVSFSYLPPARLAAIRLQAAPAPFHLRSRPGHHRLLVNGHQCVLTAPEAACVRWLARTSSFCLRDLQRRFPALDVSSLLRMLLSVGFVRLEVSTAALPS